MALERARELADGSDEGKVKEQLEPAGAPLIAVVSVGGSQGRLAQMHRMTVSGMQRWTRVGHGTRLTGLRHGMTPEHGSRSGQRAAVNVGGGHRRRFLPYVLAGRAVGGADSASGCITPPRRAGLLGRCRERHRPRCHCGRGGTGRPSGRAPGGS